MRRAIREYARTFTAILSLVAVGLVVGGYIVRHQGLRLPLIDPEPMHLEAEFSHAEAVLPGQNQTVRVAGVRVGEISGIRIEDGRAVVSMDIEDKYRWLVRRDATAMLRPRSGLKDMFIELGPGSESAPAAPDGWRIPVQNTAPDVNVDEILGPLDADVRDYLRLLVSDLGEGLRGRAPAMRSILRRFEPTHRDLARVAGALAKRRRNVRRVVHSLALLGSALADRRRDLTGLVDSSASALRAFASERDSLSASVAELPGTLREATGSLRSVERFSRVLGPAADALVPAARELGPTGAELRPLAREATPIVRSGLRPFARVARRGLPDLRRSTRRLAATTPDLRRNFRVVNHLSNMLGFNPRGREDPRDPDRQEGFLFWFAWTTHHALNAWGVTDAHGPLHNTLETASCSALRGLVQLEPQREFIDNLTAVLNDPRLCPR